MSYKILIVDDSKLARMAVAKALSSLRPDWVRLEASNADEGLAIIEAGGVDLAILDFNMPGRDGLALASEILAKHPDMPLAVVSANYQDEIVSRAADAGAHFLAKPLTEKGLSEFISRADATLKAGSR